MSAHPSPDFESELQSPETQASPYPLYRVLRQNTPVYFSLSCQAWFVTRYHDVASVLAEKGLFSNAGRQTHLLEQLTPLEQKRLEPIKHHYLSGGLINTDPPGHTRLRKLVSKAFSPAVLRSIEPLVQNIVEDLLSNIKRDREFDIIDAFAYPLPAIVIAGLLGVAPDDRALFKRWSMQANAFTGSSRPTLVGALAAQEGILSLKAYLSNLLEERRSSPRQDLLSQLANVMEGTDQLGPEEILATCCTLLFAGHETTTSLIGNAVYALLQDPDRLEELRRNPEIAVDAVEEFLRYDSPVQRVKRIALEDAKIGGVDIPAGSLIYAVIGSANRDETVFPDPDQLDFHRRSERHIAFGKGIHFCLGAALARIEARIALTALLKRFPAWTWDPNQLLVWTPGSALRSLKRLHVRLLGD